jgi:hypothetical protein
LEVSISAIESIVTNINNLTKLLFEGFERKDNHFVVTERMSVAFDTYLKKLASYLDSDNKTFQFWAATLIVHHNIKSEKAEEILLSQVENSAFEEAYVAATILCRTHNDRVINIIKGRLDKEDFPNTMMRDFYIEKLQLLKK